MKRRAQSVDYLVSRFGETLLPDYDGMQNDFFVWSQLFHEVSLKYLILFFVRLNTDFERTMNFDCFA